jgi:hypothetical protein
LFYFCPGVVPSNVEDYKLIAEGEAPIEPKPIGWSLLIYLPYKIFPNWKFLAQLFSAIFLITTLILFKKVVKDEKLVWLLLLYPYFFFYSFVGLELTLFITIVLAAWFYNNQILMMISSLFRLEGVLFSLYFIFKKKKFIYLIGLIFFIVIIYLTYGIEYADYQITHVKLVAMNSIRITTIWIPVILNKWKKFFVKNFKLLFILEIITVAIYMIIKIVRFCGLF